MRIFQSTFSRCAWNRHAVKNASNYASDIDKKGKYL